MFEALLPPGNKYVFAFHFMSGHPLIYNDNRKKKDTQTEGRTEALFWISPVVDRNRQLFLFREVVLIMVDHVGSKLCGKPCIKNALKEVERCLPFAAKVRYSLHSMFICRDFPLGSLEKKAETRKTASRQKIKEFVHATHCGRSDPPGNP
jgi:hypothetical protein